MPSGIPDFRTPETGLWANVDPMEVAHISVFRTDPERFWRFYSERFATLCDKQPNGAHRALVELEQCGLLRAVITQNIDRLHATAGTQNLIEVHGSIATCSCQITGRSYSLEAVTELLITEIPPLSEAGAPLKPDVVLFGEMLPEAAMSRATALAQSADLMIAIGSSLEVYPVAGLPELTLANGGKLALITAGETSYDSEAELKLNGDVEHELAAVIAAL